jgi:hypothetical protein
MIPLASAFVTLPPEPNEALPEGETRRKGAPHLERRISRMRAGTK